MAPPTATTEAHIALPEETSGRRVLLPSWILVPQVFLAFGWLRAAIGHAIRPEWWSGQDLRDFIADQSSESILGYDSFLEQVILSRPSVIAGVVFALQFIIGVSLFFNWRPVMALSLGAFLNLNFMLAGVVNPSIFYLVMAAGIAAWRMDERWSADFKATVAKRFGPVAFTLIALLLTGIQSVHPGTVTEDPAAVLVFYLLILIAVTWSLHEYDRPLTEEALSVPDDVSSITEHLDSSPVDSEASDSEPDDSETVDSETVDSEIVDSDSADSNSENSADSDDSDAVDSDADDSSTASGAEDCTEPDDVEDPPLEDAFALVDKAELVPAEAD